MKKECPKCAGKGYLFVGFPNVKEACFHCMGNGYIEEASVKKV